MSLGGPDLLLCVDLDNTLVRTNTLIEVILFSIRHTPALIFFIPLWALRNLCRSEALIWSQGMVLGNPDSRLSWPAAALAVLALPLAARAEQPSKPTFNRDVAPIVFQHCTVCHQPGQIASPISFVSYDAVRPWAKAIKQKVLLREMPPWSADPSRSLPFRNDARLSRHDINILVSWVDGGAPKGQDTAPPSAPRLTQAWLHPKGLKPDLVISMPGEFHAPAKGEIPYVRFLAKVPFLEDKWVSAIQAQPSNAALVHHMAITEVRLDEGVTPEDLGPLSALARQMGLQDPSGSVKPVVTDPANPAVFDMLGVYTPGTTFEMYPEDSARLLKGGKNLYINFNIHYQPTGQPEQDRSMLALWFRSGPPKHQLLRVPLSAETVIANGKELLIDTPETKAEGTRVAVPPIPPNSDNYELTAVTAFTEPVTIYQLQPHGHLRSKDFTYKVVYPDGREQTILTVPKYDFRWQLAYQLETPLHLPAGSKMVVTAHYDNSRGNPFNPAPDQPVFFRDQNQSWDEMFTPFTQYTIDTQDLTASSPPPGRGHVPIVEVAGCLARGADLQWMLIDATQPKDTPAQAASAAALAAYENKPLGSLSFQLTGVDMFSPAARLGKKVVAKGALTSSLPYGRLNLTSLRDLESCP